MVILDSGGVFESMLHKKHSKRASFLSQGQELHLCGKHSEQAHSLPFRAAQVHLGKGVFSWGIKAVDIITGGQVQDQISRF